MTAILRSSPISAPRPVADDIAQAIDLACRRIAPTWPLDRFIAVNPYWGYLDAPIMRAAAELGASCGTTLLMPRSWYLQEWRAGRIELRHLRRAITAAGIDRSPQELLAEMATPRTEPEPLLLVTDIADAVRPRREPQSWRDLVTHQISQHAAAWFDRAQASWTPPHTAGLYGSWRQGLGTARGLPVRSGHAGFASHVAALATDPRDCIEAATGALGVAREHRADYFAALLGSVRGWAAWCAYERWQARLAGRDDDQIVDLLAIRIAWELLLAEDHDLHARLPAWRAGVAEHRAQVERLLAAQQPDWLMQHARELADQERLCGGLRAAGALPRDPRPPAIEAVFCIDVRSERLRRALEQIAGDAIGTRGFAGFFGLPIDYTPLGAPDARPQLPGLLHPALAAVQESRDGADAAGLVEARHRALRKGERWGRFRSAAASAFTFVETCGLVYGFTLLKKSLRPQHGARAEHAGLRTRDVERLRPALRHRAAPGSAGQNAEVELAATVLRAMGLRGGHARLVLLCGHGSTSSNNPHAAGLDCGACGGQTGEVNARLLASLLNDPRVRAGLTRRGIALPETTRFVAGLHDTTTDEVRLFDVDDLPPGHTDDLQQLRAWLAAAGHSVRRERAPTLGLDTSRDEPPALLAAMRRRAGDWAQVRPEWGLADNFAFVVAPRARTRALDLEGRVFLHDYDWRTDEGFSVLTLILTAPMVVTNWINLQYYASTVDNHRFGSGNKVLHNVVGGNLGVFEGNGGDLRIGLPLQSIHDGARWRHTPLRLSVFVEAPATAIDGVIAEHEVVRRLVDYGWLHLHRIDPDGRVHARTPGGGWTEAAPAAEPRR